MLPSFLPLLASPETGGPLTLTVRRREGEEIIEGSLRDDAGQNYPIEQGIPRLLPREMRDAQISEIAAREGEAEPVCALPCRDRIDCGGRDCVAEGCGPGHCAPACDSLRDCPRYSVCDTAFLGTDGHGRCLPVASGATDAGADAACADVP